MDSNIYNLEKRHIKYVMDIAKECEFLTQRTWSDYWSYYKFFNNTCYVYVVDDKVVGFLIAYINQKNTCQIYIQDMGVRKKYRRNGFATELLQKLFKFAESNDITSIVLTSEKENESAMKLWEKTGFENIPDEDTYEKNGIHLINKGPGMDRTLFTKKLKD